MSQRPEDATSYDEFLRRAVRERATLFRRDSSWRVGVAVWLPKILGPLGFWFLLAALTGRPSHWWEWAGGVVFSVVFLADVSLLVRHIVRSQHRQRELARLTEEWGQRALRGEVPLTTGWHPIRRHEFRHDLQLMQSAPRSDRPQWSERLEMAAVGTFFIAAVLLYAAIASAALSAPGPLTAVLVALMLVCAASTLPLEWSSGVFQRQEHRELLARYDEWASSVAGKGAGGRLDDHARGKPFK